MVNAVQIVLLSVIVLLSIILVILGIQVFFILKDFRKTVKKTNKILDQVDIISESIAGPASSFSSFIENSSLITTAIKIIKTLRK